MTESGPESRDPIPPSRSSRAIGWCTRKVREFVLWPHLVLVAVAAYVAVVNVGPGTTVHFIDNLWPLDPRGFLGTLTYAWLPQRMGFYNVLSLQALPYTAWAAGLQTAGLSSSAQEIVTVALLEAMVGVYGFRLFRTHLLRDVAPGRRTVFALLAALAVMNNFAVQSLYWWDFLPNGFVLMAFGLAFLCYALDVWASFLTSGRLPRWPLVGMFLTATVAFAVNIPFNLAILALAVLLPPFVLLTTPPVVGGLRRLGLFLVGELGIVLACSLWWLLPSYLMTQLQPSYIGSATITAQSLQTFQSSTSSVTFLSVFGGSFGYPYSATGHLALTTAITTTVGVAFQVILPLAIFAALLVRAPPRSAALPYVVGAAVVLSFLITGVNSPLAPQFFTFVFATNVGLTALRTPFVAFGYGFEVLWVAAAALSADRYVRWWRTIRPAPADASTAEGPVLPEHRRARWRARRSEWALPIGVALVLIVVPVASAAPAAYDGDAVPVAPYLAHLSIPGYEFEVASFLEGHLDNRYALLFPGGFLNQNWTDGYDAYDILPSLMPGALLIDNYRTGFVAADDPLLDEAYTDLTQATTNTSAFVALLDQLAVGYVVVEGELSSSPYFGQAYAPQYPALLASLNATAGLSLAAVLGPDYLYAVGAAPALISSAAATVAASSLVAGEIVPEVNLTTVYRNATEVSGPGAPLHTFGPTAANGTLEFSLSASDLGNLSRSPFPAPFGPSGPPIVYNGFPLGIDTSVYPYLILNFTTSATTAISVTVVTTPDLSRETPAELTANSFDVAAPYDNLGSGDLALVGSYGANHFASPGTPTDLVVNLAGLIGNSTNRTVDYLLISLWPVVGGGGVARGTPTVDWPTPLAVDVNGVELGADVYDPPVFSATATPLATAGRAVVENETAAYWAGLLDRSPEVPERNLLPTEAGAAFLLANESVKENWSDYAVGSPFPAGGPPTFLNGGPLAWDTDQLPFLAIDLRTSNGTAFDAAVLTPSDLADLSPGALENATVYLGGSSSNAGAGDPLLTDAYGGLHFVTNGSWFHFEQDLATTNGAAPPTTVNYLVLQLAYVAPDGTANHGLPVSDWPGVQELQLGGVTLANVGSTPGTTVQNGTWLGFVGPTPAKSPAPLAPDVVVTPAATGPLDPVTVDSVVQVSPTEVDATVTFGSTSILPSLIVFHETYSSGWQLAANSEIRLVDHIAVDGAQNGYLVTPVGPNSTVTLRLVFVPQAEFAAALWGGLALPIVASAAVLVLAARRRSRLFA